MQHPSQVSCPYKTTPTFIHCHPQSLVIWQAWARSILWVTISNCVIEPCIMLGVRGISKLVNTWAFLEAISASYCVWWVDTVWETHGERQTAPQAPLHFTTNRGWSSASGSTTIPSPIYVLHISLRCRIHLVLRSGAFLIFSRWPRCCLQDVILVFYFLPKLTVHIDKWTSRNFQNVVTISEKTQIYASGLVTLVKDI
jgi:hypothetical protein